MANRPQHELPHGRAKTTRGKMRAFLWRGLKLRVMEVQDPPPPTIMVPEMMPWEIPGYVAGSSTNFPQGYANVRYELAGQAIDVDGNLLGVEYNG